MSEALAVEPLGLAMRKPAGSEWTYADLDLGRNVFEPDIVVMHEAAYKREGPLRAVDLALAVEVTSPSSRSMDRIVKPAALSAAGVPNYWRVDIDGDPYIEIYELDAGAYKVAGIGRAATPLRIGRPFELEIDPAVLVR
jgi:Uma2 family endonuclease